MPSYSIDQIDEFIHSTNPMKRVIAARRGSEFGNHFIKPLHMLLEDEFYECRAYAAKTLGVLHHYASLFNIISLLDDEVEEVRFSAAEALGYFRDEAVINPLLKRLSDHSRETQRQSVNSLTKQDHNKVYEVMMTWIHQIKPDMYEMLSPEAIHHIDVVRGIMEACSRFPCDWTSDILSFGLRSPDLEMQRLAAISIGNLQLHDFAEDLLKKRAVADDDLRLAIVYALSRIKFDSKLEILLNYIDDNYDFVRMQLAQCLPSNFQIDQILPYISKLVTDPFYLVRSVLAQNISKIDYLPHLEVLLSDTSDEVRKSVITSLSLINDQQSLDVLTAYTDTDDLVEMHRLNAITYLQQTLKKSSP